METWKPVVGFEGWYEVSDHGRVRRVSSAMGTRSGKILKPWFTSGYPTVSLSIQRQVTKRLVHVLVAQVFLEPQPSIKYEVNHKDGNRDNPRAKNLEWMTRSENLSHGRRTHGSWGTVRLNEEKTHCPQGHPYAGENLRIRKSGGRACRACARDYARRKRKEVMPNATNISN